MNPFSTRDIRLAAAILSCVGAQLVGFDRSDPAKITFFFHREDITEEFVEGYQNQEIRVEPLRYGMAKRYLEKMVYEGFAL